MIQFASAMRWRVVLSFAAWLLFQHTNVLAQDWPAPATVLVESQWLKDFAETGPGVSSVPPLFPATEAAVTSSLYAQLGRIAFRSPLLFGGRAARAGMSCHSCHLNGHRHPEFFLETLSAAPGTVDVSNNAFHARLENHKFDAQKIPSLRGIVATPPFGWRGQTASLRTFVRHVAVAEFAGDEPAPWLLDSLVAHLQNLEFAPMQHLDATGLPQAQAPLPVQRGAALFFRPFSASNGASCASCHVPRQAFQDGKIHDVGTGGYFNTPSLRNSDGPPFFHDGRAATRQAVIAHFEKAFSLSFSTEERDDLSAYLAAVAGGNSLLRPVTFAREFNRLSSHYKTGEDLFRHEWDAALVFTLGSLRRELGRLYRRFVDHAEGEDSKRAQARQALRQHATCLVPVVRALQRSAIPLSMRTEARNQFAKCQQAFIASQAILESALPDARFPKNN